MAQMKNTVMKEGKPYYAVGGILKHYPKFVPEDYVILELRPRYQSGEWVRWNYELPPGVSSDLVEAARVFSNRNIGYRGVLGGAGGNGGGAAAFPARSAAGIVYVKRKERMIL